jgi:hypothetical protein
VPDEVPPPPPPPTFQEIYIYVLGLVPKPEPRFAPPVERGGNIGAVVGKRLYAHLSEVSFSEREHAFSFGNGFWYVTAVLTPHTYEFGGGGSMSDPCDHVINLGATAAGRKQLDAEGCSLLITRRNANKQLPVRFTSYWQITLKTNVDDIPTSFVAAGTMVYDVPVKQIQAVVG